MKTKIIEEIERSINNYNRLILIVGQYNSGKTSLIREIGKDLNLDVINVNLELSRNLLDMSKKERMIQAQSVFNSIIEKNIIKDSVVLLDNIEILFDYELKIDPLKVLKDLSKYYCVVATFSGKLDNNSIIYSQTGHREYRKYQSNELITYSMD